MSLCALANELLIVLIAFGVEGGLDVFDEHVLIVLAESNEVEVFPLLRSSNLCFAQSCGDPEET